MPTNPLPTVADYADTLTRLVRADVVEEPHRFVGAAEFGDLHDVCDANEYFIAADEHHGIDGYDINFGPAMDVRNRAVGLLEERGDLFPTVVYGVTDRGQWLFRVGEWRWGNIADAALFATEAEAVDAVWDSQRGGAVIEVDRDTLLEREQVLSRLVSAGRDVETSYVKPGTFRLDIPTTLSVLVERAHDGSLDVVRTSVSTTPGPVANLTDIADLEIDTRLDMPADAIDVTDDEVNMVGDLDWPTPELYSW